MMNRKFWLQNQEEILTLRIVLKESSMIASDFFQASEIWYRNKAYTFLITPGEFYS